jgi:hypothetical protein
MGTYRRLYLELRFWTRTHSEPENAKFQKRNKIDWVVLIHVKNLSTRLKPLIIFFWIFRTFQRFIYFFQSFLDRNFQDTFLLIKYKPDQNFVVQDWRLLQILIQKLGSCRSVSKFVSTLQEKLNLSFGLKLFKT